ncbi:hypothetical protein [Fervidibacillus albus]|uniref:Uncharacterized protein n=1 Tax=Fervidibacillus albus TaxID=2980026 RepID=A0A9E8LS12_9BACI|nr:hypothetical protein [Fervidibacillus albus]WAA08547.1 hypothetical protein OE104_07775 [Fervidibacillus albus]
MKKSLLVVGIIGVLVSQFWNYQYYHSKQLEKPIFLTHYYDHTFYQNDEYTFSFYYLTNKNEPKQIQYMIADGVIAYPYRNDDEGITYSDHVSPVDEYDYQYLFSSPLSFSYEEIPFDEDGTWSFQEVTVRFTDGDSVTTDIGKVVFRKKRNPNHSEAIDFTAQGSRTDGTGTVEGYATKSLKIESIETLLGEELAGNIHFTLNGTEFNTRKPIDPIFVEKDEEIEILWEMGSLASTFEVELDFTGTTETGESFISSLLFTQLPDMDEKTVNELIQEKTGDKQ